MQAAHISSHSLNWRLWPRYLFPNLLLGNRHGKVLQRSAREPVQAAPQKPTSQASLYAHGRRHGTALELVQLPAELCKVVFCALCICSHTKQQDNRGGTLG